jgi:asparagine synthase (glutamine-hydrolysing)
MCGICGTLSLAGRPVVTDDLRGMLDVMAHRGPDAEGILEAPGIAAGIRRLAVIDVAGGDQPISNEDGSVSVVFNGEIYNFEDLRDGLIQRGHRFRTRSDTEVLVHLWEEDGPDLLRHLNGMFAFCLHDRQRNETIVARDRLGIKPLYYRAHGDVLAFASELATLLRHDAVEKEVDTSSLVELYCLQYLAGDATVYRGVKKLLPGHLIHVRDGDAEVRRWYEPRPAGEAPPPDREDRDETLRRLLDSSVRYRKIADVPLGAFLSGGIDSTIVVGLLSRVAGGRVKTFSVGFDGDGGYDERRYARLAAERFGTEHHELVVSPVDIAAHLPRLVAHLAEPVTDPAMIPTYLLSEYARKEVTVVLTGEGADELFGGYRRYVYESRYAWLAGVPGVRLATRSGLPRVLPGRTGQAMDALATQDSAARHVQWSSVLGRSIAGRLFESDAIRGFEERTAAHFRRYFHGGGTHLAQVLEADQNEWLPHDLLAKVDRASMAWSLEARVPFLDHRVVEWANALPDADRIAGNDTKVILRRAFRDDLPREIRNRPKRGFDLPLAIWIRGPLREIAEDLLTPPRLARWPGLEVSFATRMFHDHLAGRRDFGLPLFNILSMMLFLEDRAP